MKHFTLLLLLSFALIQSVIGQNEPKPFITTWNLPGEGSLNIPLSNNQTYDFEFYVIQESDTLSSGTHTNSDGNFDFFSFQSITVELHIYGQFPHFANYSKDLLIDVNQWGDVVWQSMAESFKDWPGSNFSATDRPDLSNVTSMNRMFQAANAFNADISSWDVSNIKNFGVLFFQAHAFNRDISNWNVSSASNMISMFRDTKSFNQDLSSWDVDSVGNMMEMFMDTKAFNGDISAWDIRSVNNFSKFLEGASSFSDRNYDKLLIAWADLADSVGVVENNKFDARGKIFCLSEESRNFLINNFNWQFNDGGKQCSSANDILSFSPEPFPTIGDLTINTNEHLVQIYLPSTGDFTNITPEIEVSSKAIISPESGERVDLSTPITYTVTAFDGTEQEWTVEVLSRPFITTWEVASASETITIPTNTEDYFEYKWLQDGFEIESGFHNDVEDGDFSTTFSEAGSYQLEILGYFTHFVDYPKDQLIDVNQWGDIVWQDMSSSFEDWPGDDFSATDAPDLSNVENMRNMFLNASNFNSPLDHWDVSNVTLMRNLFSSASSFNQNLDNWNVSKVSDFESVFRNASAFNGNISNWQVNEATTMFLMFSGAEDFNQDITNWQTGKVRDMRGMFALTKEFNQDIIQWNVSSVENMGGMFEQALNFNQDLSSWNIANVTNMAGMFNGSGLSPQNYDKTLIGWSAQEVQSTVTLDAVGITFCKGEDARQSLIDANNWEITDGGKTCSSETNIIFFHSNLENGLGIIHTSDGVISLAITEDTDLSAIEPTIELSQGATISPESGTLVDLINVVYTVTAEDGTTTQDWTFEFTGPRFITTWVVEGAEGLILDGSEEGFDYAFEFVLIDSNNKVISSGEGDSFDVLLPLEAGEYRLEITDEFPHFVGYPGDQLLDVLQWGDIEWKTMKNSFEGWEGTEFSAPDTPDLSQVTDMSGMFADANNFNSDLSEWNVSNVEDMNEMFRDAEAFNGDLSSWDVSKVEDMSGMFQNASSFAGNVQSWEVALVNNMDEVFNNAGISPQNYDKILVAWSAQEVQNNVTLGAEGITFCKGAEARQSLIENRNWTINDNGNFCSPETDILTFAIEGQLGETTINAENHTVSLVMPFVTNFTALAPTFTLSTGASANPESGETKNFSSSVAYTITAEDSTTKQDWIITVNRAPNSATDIETVTADAELKEAFIDTENHSVYLLFVHGTDISDIQLFFTYSEGATSSVGEEGIFDFINPLAITVTAEDDSTQQEWVISAEIAPNTATDILTFSLENQTGAALINTENHTVTIEIALETSLTDLIPEFTLSEGASSNPTTGEALDFNNPVPYIITAEDGITIQEWLITVKMEDENVLGIGKEQKESIGLHYYPNPTQNLLNINARSEVKVYLIDLNGQQVISPTTGVKLELDLTSLNEGIYLLVVKSKDLIFTEKVIKN